jgi:hypothetical protein
MSDTLDIATPGLEFVFEASGALSAPLQVGPTPFGVQRVIPIEPGSAFEGPMIRGVTLGGHDWQTTRADGVTVVDATYLLETDDGVRLQCRNRGLRHGSEAVMRRLAAGEPVAPSEYYFRAAPEFVAPAGRYDWMNRSLFVCTGARFPAAVKLRFFRVL